MQKQIRYFSKRVGKAFARPDVGGLMTLVIVLIGLGFGSDWQVYDWGRFLFHLIIFTFIGVAILQIIGQSLIWISKQINLLKIKERNDSTQDCSIDITNNYDEDLTELCVRLKRITGIGMRSDFRVTNPSPFFVEDEIIKSGHTKNINIAKIIELNKTQFIEFLIIGGWKDNHLHSDITNESEEVKNTHGRWGGMLYEFILEITGKIEGEYINPLTYRGVISNFVIYHIETASTEPANIKWVIFDRFFCVDLRNEKERNKKKLRSDDEIITSSEDFWSFLEQVEKGKKVYSNVNKTKSK